MGSNQIVRLIENMWELENCQNGLIIIENFIGNSAKEMLIQLKTLISALA